MANLSPDALFDHADRLAASRSLGTSPQWDIRRAISAAYYALFHFTMACVADILIGSAPEQEPIYRLAYRSVSHRALRDLCDEINKKPPTKKYSSYFPASGFHPNLLEYGKLFVQLQDDRQAADYDVFRRFYTIEAQFAVSEAREARQHFLTADAAHQRVFLTLLAFPPRPQT